MKAEARAATDLGLHRDELARRGVEGLQHHVSVVVDESGDVSACPRPRPRLVDLLEQHEERLLLIFASPPTSMGGLGLGPQCYAGGAAGSCSIAAPARKRRARPGRRRASLQLQAGTWTHVSPQVVSIASQ